MRLAINASSLRSHGSGFVGRALLDALTRVPGLAHIDAWVPKAWNNRPLRPDTKLEIHAVLDGPVGRAGFELFCLTGALRACHADAYLSLVNAPAETDPVLPQLVLVHQALLAYPEREWDFTLSPRARTQVAVLARSLERGLEFAKVWTVQSQAMKDAMIRRWGIPGSAIHVVPHDIGEVQLASPMEHPGLPLRLYYAAHHGSYKNHVVLAGAAKELRRRGVRALFLLSVNEGEVGSLSAEAQRLGVSDAFVYLGPQSRETSLRTLAGSFAAVVPSKIESYGLGLFEAMAAGVPVIASDKPYAREACGLAALYADADSPRAFADHVEHLASDEGLRAHLVAAGRERYERNRRSWDQVAVSYLEILEGRLGA